MDFDTDVLIVGAGPTGLMLACQLSRFGIPFKIIDKEENKAQESRAIGIQAKSMEIFQNLGIVDEFLKLSKIAKEPHLYFNHKLIFKFNFQDIILEGTPFPKLFFLPQSKTEQILTDFLEKSDFHIERKKDLISFDQNTQGVISEIKNLSSNTIEKIKSRYIVGCDGAKSTVRKILNVPFEGGSYEQDFVLIDATVKWQFPVDDFSLFVTKHGIIVSVPLEGNLNRLIMAGIKENPESTEPPSIEEMEMFAKNVTGVSVKIENPIWISRFHLHHRAVKQYQKGLAFLAGDSAHIHSPVGGQGMNTGLQDAANLAWKMALILKYHAPSQLLDTYQIERQRIGSILLKTTDRLFGFMTSKNSFVTFFRLYLLPHLLHFLTNSTDFQKKIFWFMSELSIHYHKNTFIDEYVNEADDRFLRGPKTGERAPDVSLSHSSLFEIFREKPFNVLVFQDSANLSPEQENTLKELKTIHPDLIAIHEFKLSENKILFEKYGVTSSALYFIRPDGYIGFRAFGCKLEKLKVYLDTLFGSISAPI
jgi:2-polyprenyl-6-methoxyphenol hydroxylase-like FAD-dependent oxidoreductase